HQHHGLAGLGGGLHAIKASNGVHRIFDRPDDVGFDSLRGGAGIADDDSHHGKIDVGQLFDRQSLVGVDPEHHDRHHDHGGKDGVIDADAGKEHGSAFNQRIGIAGDQLIERRRDDHVTSGNTGNLDQVTAIPFLDNLHA